MIAVYGDGFEVGVYGAPPVVQLRNTNNILLPLNQDEVVALIAQLAKQAQNGDVVLHVAVDRITYPREVFD